MGTVIDELVTILGLDIAPGVMAKVNKFNSVLDSVTRTVGWVSAGLVAAASSAMVFAERMNRESFGMQKFSDLTGVSTDALQEFGFAAEQAGGRFDGMQNDLMSLAKSMSSPVPGEFNHALFMLGVSAHDTRGKLKTADQVMMDIAKKFEGMSKIRQLQWGSRIGLSDDTVLLLGQGVARIKELRQQARDIPTIVSPEQLKNAKEFTIQLSMVRRIISYISQEAAAVAGPALKNLTGDFTDWLKLNREFIQSGLKSFIAGTIAGFKQFGDIIRKIKGWFADTFPAIDGFLGRLDKTKVVGNLVFTALTALAVVIAVLVAKWVLITAAIIAAGVALDDFFTYLRGGDSLFGRFVGWLTKIGEKYPHITKAAKDFWEVLKKVPSAYMTFLETYWKAVKKIGEALGWVLDKMLGLIDASIGMLSDAMDSEEDEDLGTPVENMRAKTPAASYRAVPGMTAHGRNGPVVINVTQNIQGTNAPAIAAESRNKMVSALQSTYPGGLSPVTN